MTQIASPKSILAPFDRQSLRSRGRTYQIWRDGDRFFVRMPDPDWEGDLQQRGMDVRQITHAPTVDRQIVMVTGSHHYQVFWVPSVRGLELRQFPWAYLLDDQRWVPSEDVFIRPPNAPRRFALWNNNCIQCHSVAGNPGIQRGTGDLYSEVVDLGISCEACHGPGLEHVRKHRNPLERYRQRFSDQPDRSIVNPRKCTPEKSAEICGQCHSNFDPINTDDWFRNGYSYRAGGDFEAAYRVRRFNDSSEKKFHNDAFWKDGTMRIGGREYTAMTDSACYQQGRITCLSCHQMHGSDPNDQLASSADGDNACVKCHNEYRQRSQLEVHTHHRAESSGSRCYECHMPYTSFALLKGIRSHRIDSPSVRVSVETGRPNACNLCHADRTLQWTADYLKQWYGKESPRLNNEQREVAATLIWLLRGDAVQRAVTAANLGRNESQETAGDNWQAPFIAQLLCDPYSAVRMVAFRALQKLPGFEHFRYDFLASRLQREQAARDVVGQWQSRARRPRGAEQLLIGDDGQLLTERMQELLQQRDDRNVELPE